jgi:hypothetical protein
MIAGPHRRVTLAVGGILLCLAAAPGIAAQTCLEPPWSGGADELYRLAGRALSVVADYPSLQRALETEAPFPWSISPPAFYNHNWKIDPIVRSLIDTDFYKLLMCQSIFRNRPDTSVVFSLINRTKLRCGWPI